MPGVGEVDLDDPALALAEHDRVRVLEVVARAGRVVAEEVAVQVERVDQVELGEVREVDPHRLRPADADRVLGEVEREPVDRVEVVLAVAVGVEAVHHHDELLRGLARLGRVDDERAVQALVDVLLQRGRVAVVELHPVGPGGELVREGLPGSTTWKTPSMSAGWIPWKWIVCGCDPPLKKLTSSMSSSVARMTGPGTVPLYVQAEKRHALRDLDVAVDGREVVPADPAGGVRERRRRIREHVERAGLSGRGNRVSHHRRVTERGMVVVPLMRRAQPGRVRHSPRRAWPSGQPRPPAQRRSEAFAS